MLRSYAFPHEALDKAKADLDDLGLPRLQQKTDQTVLEILLKLPGGTGKGPHHRRLLLRTKSFLVFL